MRLTTNLSRLLVMTIAGTAAGILVGFLMPWPFGVIAGWGVGCLVYVMWVWIAIWRFDAERTLEHAQREDPTRAVSDIMILTASIASLVAVGILLQTSEQSGMAIAASIFAVGSIALSWLLVHTLYSLRYARQYYAKKPIGGIDFNQPDPPQYSDFAYFAFNLGMTFQVSDNNISSPALRKIILAHTLISYLFNTVVIASVVNLVVNLASAG